MSVKLRQELERKIVTRVIKDGIAAGFTIDVYDGEEFVLKGSTDVKKILSVMFTTDEDSLYLKKYGIAGWVAFIYGNDGHDVIHDYSTNLEDVLKGAEELADSYA
jgi:hypothetical protein